MRVRARRALVRIVNANRECCGARGFALNSLEVIVTTPFWCLFIGCVIPFLLAPIASFYKSKQFESLDFKNPRVQTAALEGAGARAAAAQSNAWEALAVFGAAVLVNHVSNGDPGTSATLAMVWVAARVAHAGAYIAGLAPVRSGVFLVGLVCAFALFFV